jgi:hypothetical protein
MQTKEVTNKAVAKPKGKLTEKDMMHYLPH